MSDEQTAQPRAGGTPPTATVGASVVSTSESATPETTETAPANLIAARAMASHAMEGEEHRRTAELEELVEGGVLPQEALLGDSQSLDDFSILLARQREMAESAMEGPERHKAREAAEAAEKARLEAIKKQKEEAARLLRLKEQEQADLRRITDTARARQHRVLEEKQTTMEQLLSTPALTIRPVRTLKEDMDQAMKGKNISLVGIAIKEDERKRAEEVTAVVETKKSHLFSVVAAALIIGGVALGGYAAYTTYFKTSPEGEQAVVAQQTSIVFAEKQKIVPVRGLSDTQLISILKNEVRNLNAPLSTIENEYLIESSTQNNSPQDAASPSMGPISFQRFASIVRFRAPNGLLRNVEPTFMLGVHSAPANAGFLILRPQAYDRVFAGLLEWEPSLVNDLYVILSGKSADSELIKAPFTDVIIKNIATRVVRDNSGTIVFLYSFFDKNTLIITTDEATFVEIITRLTTPRPILQK